MRQSGQLRGLISYLCAAGAACLALWAIIYFKATPNREVAPPPPQAPLTRQPPREPPSTLISETPILPPEPLRRPSAPKVELPNLNAQAGDYLSRVDGRWTDGSTVVVISAKGPQGCVGRAEEAVRMQPLTVRDISGTMVVADIGPHRFILLRQPDGLSISGGSLAVPLKLHR